MKTFRNAKRPSCSSLRSQLVLQHQWLADGSSKLVFVLRHLNVSVSATAPLAIFLSLLLYYYIHKHKDGRRVWY